ncbi:hypothetical protein NM688_g7276 [Phlebia brevispora]|uniref:Uncharacterized protein n=1 Tax=Phlebia brevispora TaxID=194682 RepID=A0ACC1S781_9APHY|nr:hypothetical protein NM688_g7276 [Phlebia brevispora]
MPNWSQERVQPPWSKPHTVTLKSHEIYDRAAANGGSDRIERHAPLSLANGHGRKAGTSGAHAEQDTSSQGFFTILNGSASTNGYKSPNEWKQELKSGSHVVSVRDIKNGTENFKVTHPKHHAFARYVLPVDSVAFSSQDWPGKNHEKGEGDKQQKQDESDSKKPQLDTSLEEKRFHDKLVEELNTIRNFQNDDGHPEGDLQLLDGDALMQLASGLCVEDQITPDSWVPRSSKLLRLTGTHPLNAEANLTELFDAGMITPTKLHYVRSHGAVPQLSWETHKLSVYSDPPGLVYAREWSMDEIAEGNFRVIEIPITIACDGNRRKEMNMIKQTAGVNFSAAGVSTCLWRGVYVRDILLASGLKDQPDTERWYLNFEGADECSEGTYATSIPLMHAMDVNNDVILAFGQNKRVLHPDHGYPLRAIIPGYVGGRQVKWVQKLYITKEPNSSYYHIWDNRVLPAFIKSKDDPLAVVFHNHESTACMEQTLQSVICKPAHNEVILLPNGIANGIDKCYTVQGFAYNGCGTAINRVELTTDGGKTWKYCFKRYIPKPLRNGEKHWAWIFWSCDVPLKDLSNSRELAVRACDGKMQTQPEHMSWNMTGMMNNAWYRIRHVITADPQTGNVMIQFRHPVAPGSDESDWMKPDPEDVQSDDNKANGDQRVLSLEEIAKHNSTNDCWIIIDNKVYDVTDVLSWHPGGAAAILAYAGKATVAATLQYKGIHDNCKRFPSLACDFGTQHLCELDANSKRDECYIGVLSNEAVGEMKKDAMRAADALAKVKKEREDFALQPDLFTSATLVKKTEVSEDTRYYVFSLPKRANGEHGLLKLPVGRHIMLSVHFDDQAVLRPYTPIAPVLPEEEDGTFTLCVKTYFPTDGGPYPPGGLVSNYLDCMNEGEEIDIRGPEGEITYKGRGKFDIEGKEYQFEKINLIAGGSGLTPHWQLIHAVLSDSADETAISLIDCNKTYDDILMRDELQRYASKHPKRFKLWHAVSKAPEGVADWKYGEGSLDQKLMEEYFHPATHGVATLLCGPPGLIEKCALPALEKMGFKKGESSSAPFCIMPGPSNRKGKSKKGRTSGAAVRDLSNVDIPTVLDAYVDEINDAQDWEGVVHLLCRMFELPAAWKKIHAGFSDIQSNLDVAFRKYEGNEKVMGGIVGIWARMCVDSILRDKLFEAGLLNKMLPLLDIRSTRIIGLQALSTVTHHGGAEIRCEIAKHTPKLLQLMEEFPDDYTLNELAIITLSHAVSAVLTADDLDMKAIQQLDIPKVLRLTMQNVRRPAASYYMLAHSLDFLSHATLNCSREIKAIPSIVNLLVACLRSNELTDRCNALGGLARLTNKDSEPDTCGQDLQKFMATLQRGFPKHLSDLLMAYDPRRCDTYLTLQTTTTSRSVERSRAS